MYRLSEFEFNMKKAELDYKLSVTTDQFTKLINEDFAFEDPFSTVSLPIAPITLV